MCVLCVCVRAVGQGPVGTERTAGQLKHYSLTQRWFLCMVHDRRR